MRLLRLCFGFSALLFFLFCVCSCDKEDQTEQSERNSIPLSFFGNENQSEGQIITFPESGNLIVNKLSNEESSVTLVFTTPYPQTSTHSGAPESVSVSFHLDKLSKTTSNGIVHLSSNGKEGSLVCSTRFRGLDYSSSKSYSGTFTLDLSFSSSEGKEGSLVRTLQNKATVLFTLNIEKEERVFYLTNLE